MFSVLYTENEIFSTFLQKFFRFPIAFFPVLRYHIGGEFFSTINDKEMHHDQS